jgi:hypothetical protein
MVIKTNEAKIFPSALSLRQPLSTLVLRSAFTRGRLAQAYLLTGNALDDKWALVLSLARHLNCLKSKEGADGACFSKPLDACCINCRWIANREHPQALLELNNDTSKSGKISVESARALCQELAKSSQYYRVAVVENSTQDIFHRPAANALLKTIEEPKSPCLIFFFALSPEDVLATVVSRCQVIRLNSVNFEAEGTVSNKTYCSLPSLAPEQMLQLEQACRELRSAKTLKFDLSLSRMLAELPEGEVSLDSVIDLILHLEGRDLKMNQFGKLKVAHYAKGLLELCELTKRQIKHYVSKKAAMESFTFSLKQLQIECGINK